MAKSVAKTFAYKTALNLSGKAVDVQTLLSKAMQHSPKAAARLFTYGQGDEGRMLINRFITSDNMVFGVFCAFEPGKHQPVLDYNADLDEFPIEAIAPPPGTDAKGQSLQKEFLESLLYFGVRGSHVVLVQSLALRSSSFENYLNWLICKKTKVATDDSVVFLNDQFNPSVLKKINKARGITMTRPVEFSFGKTKDKSGEIFLKPKGSAWDAIKSFVGENNPILPNGLRLRDVVKDGQIHPILELRWKYKRDADDTPLLDQVANVLRHTDEVDYTIDMGRYGKLTKTELKLSKGFDVDIFDGRPNEEQLFRKMKEWIEELISSGRILAKPIK